MKKEKTEIFNDEISQNNVGITLDLEKKVFPLLLFFIGLALMLAQWTVQLNLVVLVGIIFMCVTALFITLGLFIKHRLYLYMLFGYVLVSFGIFAYFIVAGSDAGWGAFMSGKTGYVLDNWFQGEGNFWTRLLGNIVLISPIFVVVLALVLSALYLSKHKKIQQILTCSFSVLMIVSSILFVFITNLRTDTIAFNMSDGEDDYLSGITGVKNKKNVIVILMDDLGYGDVGFNDETYSATTTLTPYIDSVAMSDDSIIFDNYYSSYSVCSPSRFACLTGRYPYRGYADNVVYPTDNTLTTCFPATRVYNSFEMGGNVDGMLSDEITIAEVLSNAGYSTAAFAKWHLGDYGDYLPTNQGFDYFYGGYHVNDMSPYFLAEETNGQYTIVEGVDTMDQSKTTELVNTQVMSWLDSLDTNNDNSLADEKNFFMYYATPWPHAPVFTGENRMVTSSLTDELVNIGAGSTGLGTYADCVHEFDYYIGELIAKLKAEGVYDDTTIVFTSDNGPALEGSTNNLRGGKYTPYEAGQKMPFFITHSGYEGLWSSKISTPVTMVDLFPTFIELLGVTGTYNNNNYDNFLPSDVDREIDGISMVGVLKGEDQYIHDIDHPILHMKREKIQAIQYSMDADCLTESEVYDNTSYDYVTFKYFKNVANDNPAFFDKRRRNWLINLTIDETESYNVQKVYPDIAKQYLDTMNNWTKKLSDNRRGIISTYYNK